jgi:hypothetical protein
MIALILTLLAAYCASWGATAAFNAVCGYPVFLFPTPRVLWRRARRAGRKLVAWLDKGAP